MDNMSKGKRLIFVGGSPRSGTTLVQNILDSHPNICGAPEFFCVPDILEVRKTLRHYIKIEWIDTICSYEHVDRCIASLIEDLLVPLADRQNCVYLSEKTPHHVLVFSELLPLFPESRFIHVVRDPRAVVASLLQVGKRARAKGQRPARYTAKVSAAIRHVKQYLSAGLAASKAAPDRVLTVIYERLVADPETETKRICKFLDVEWAEEMLHPGKKEHLGEKAQASAEIWYDSRTYNRDPETGEIDKWRNQLTPIQQIMIARSLREFADLGRYGYDLSLDGFSPTNRAFGSILSLTQNMIAGVIASRLKRRLRALSSPVRGFFARADV